MLNAFIMAIVPRSYVAREEWWAAEIIVLLAGTLPNAEANLTAMAIFSNTCALAGWLWSHELSIY